MTRTALRIGLFCVVGWVLTGIPLGGAAAVPVAYGTPTSFKVTVKNCQLSADGGSTWTTIWTTGIEMDVATVSKGDEALKFVQNFSIPFGTYNKMRYTVDAVMKITGSITYSGSTYYTSTSAVNDPTSGPAVEYTFTNPSGDTSYTNDVSVVVQNAKITYARISFNIDQGAALYLAGAGIYKILPNQVTPSVTVNAPAAPMP